MANIIKISTPFTFRPYNINIKSKKYSPFTFLATIYHQLLYKHNNMTKDIYYIG